MCLRGFLRDDYLLPKQARLSLQWVEDESQRVDGRLYCGQKRFYFARGRAMTTAMEEKASRSREEVHFKWIAACFSLEQGGELQAINGAV